MIKNKWWITFSKIPINPKVYVGGLEVLRMKEQTERVLRSVRG
jgi:hypothetical protein